LSIFGGYTVSQGSWRTAPNLILPNKWYQVSVVYSFDNPTVPPVFYINGVQQSIVTTVLTPSGLPVKESGVLYVGDNPSTDGTVSTRVWNGILDELRIYNRVVFQSELANLYSQENKPNIVVIMTDDQDDMGSMEVLKKVKILLKDKGVTFTNSFVSFPVCCASRASFMTGQYPHNHKIIGNAPAEGGGFLKFALATSPELSTKNSLSVWMQQAGYETTLMGKFLNGYGNQATTDPESAPTYVPPGWDQWMGMPDFYNDGTANFGTYNYFNFAINNNGVIEKYNKGEYQTDTLAKKAVDFITARENSPKPFFIWVTPIAPHYGGNGDDATGGPFPAPRHKGLFSTLPITMNPNFNEADVSDKPDFIKKLPVMNATVIASTSQSFRNRRETLLAVDDMVESIVNALQKTNKLDNTIIIFTSDNGFAQGEHRRSQGKRVLYEESIRVPLVITGPGIPAGETRNQLVNNLDVVATILEVSHAKPGRTIDGKSLVEVFKNKAASWRKALLIEGTDTQVGGTGSTDSRYVAIRTDNYILAYHSTSSSPVIEKEFYDLSKDPYELENKKNDTNYSSVINNLSVSLDALKNCTGSSCFVTNQIVNNSNSPSTLNSIANAISVPFTLFSRGIKSNLNLVASMMGVPPSYALEETTGGWWFKK
jgi:arylsulfatase A-like enzyme